VSELKAEGRLFSWVWLHSRWRYFHLTQLPLSGAIRVHMPPSISRTAGAVSSHKARSPSKYPWTTSRCTSVSTGQWKAWNIFPNVLYHLCFTQIVSNVLPFIIWQYLSVIRKAES